MRGRSNPPKHEFLAENRIEQGADDHEEQQSPVANQLRFDFGSVQQTPKVKIRWLSEERKDGHPQLAYDPLNLELIDPGEHDDREKPPP